MNPLYGPASAAFANFRNGDTRPGLEGTSVMPLPADPKDLRHGPRSGGYIEGGRGAQQTRPATTHRIAAAELDGNGAEPRPLVGFWGHRHR